VKGHVIDSNVRAAFEQLWPWFWRYVDDELGDPDRAGDLAEEVAYRVSTHLEMHPGQVRSVVGLCRVAAANFVLSVRTREKRIEFRGLSHDVEATLGVAAPNWREEVELWIWVDQLLHDQNREIRTMFELRLLEETWEEIGEFLGLTAGQARLRFKRALQHILERGILRRPDRGSA
jgi:DNA-directed RNA polymerase specialized sigma24 family protein